jgi:nitrate/nitrite transporter NarK
VAFFTPMQSLLPRLAQEVAPDSKEIALDRITGTGAFASIFVSPLAGALSDSTPLSDRSGRRTVHVILSTVVMAVAAAVLAFFPRVPRGHARRTHRDRGGGCTGLYLMTAAITVLSAVLVTRIRGVP